eukprot:gene6086-7584_t
MMHAIGEIFKPEEKPIKRARDKCGFTCCLVWSFKTIVRVVCIIAGALQTGMGGYVFYSISSTKDKSVKNYLQLSVIGIYACLTGLMILFAESRTRWTRRAVKVFIFLCNGLARGLVYLIIGGVDVPIPFKVFFVTSLYIGLVVVLGGILSIFEFLFTWRRNRARMNKAIATRQEENKKTQLYDLFEKEDSFNKNKLQEELEMKPMEEA